MGVVHSISDFRATISYTVPALWVEWPPQTNRIWPRLPKKKPFEKNSGRGGTRGTVIAEPVRGGWEIEKGFRTNFDIERAGSSGRTNLWSEKKPAQLRHDFFPELFP